MTVVVLTACSPGLRGHLTRWLVEVAPGIFVGRVTARVRERLWSQVLDLQRDGKALIVSASSNDQGFQIRSSGHDWHPVDHEGLTLMVRPAHKADAPENSGW